MTQAPGDSLADRVRAWRFNVDLDLPELLARDDRARLPAGEEYGAYAGTIEGVAILTGSERAGDVAPLVANLAHDVAVLEREAARQLSWSWMALVDVVGVFAAMGASGAAALRDRAARCLASISTSRSDERVHYHWNRGLAALACDLPAIYRPISGHELGAPLGFVPGQRFGPNIQGLLGHLAAAVEHRAPLDECLPAWRNVLADFPVLERARSLDAASLVWIASILHHRVAGGPLGGVADFLRKSVEELL